tara:strand:- start:1627 stop:1935 length:309 start_codon:yes stop_codon:yes gene_type:complete
MAFSRSSTVVGTSATDLLATVSGETVVIGLVVANVSSSTDNITVLINNGSDNFHLIKSAPVPVGSTLSVLDGKVVLGSGDSVKVHAGASATALEATISVLTL